MLSRACCCCAGEEPHSGIVASISSGNPALVTCVDDERLEFQVGVWGRCFRGREGVITATGC
jgi:hypothetical protein